MPVAAIRILVSKSTLPPPPQPAVSSHQEPEPAAPAPIDIPRREPLPVVPARDLLVATILDAHSAKALQYEWRSVELTPHNWRGLLAEHKFDLLFVGPGGPLDLSSPQLRELVTGLRGRGIPSAFWNTQDPLGYDLHLATAKLFDVVFTVAEECVPRYQEDLGHDRVHLVPFGVQPRVYNPVSIGPRDRPLALLGSYSNGDQVGGDLLVQPALEVGLEILDEPGTDDGDRTWPDQFLAHYLGRLDHDQVPNAYKTYRGFLHLDDGSQSPSVCPRRVLELAASNTPIISTDVAAIERFLAQGFVRVTSPEEARASLRFFLQSEEYRARIAHLALRAVMRRHTTSHRVDAILEQVGLEVPGRGDGLPLVTAVAPSNRPELVERTIATAASQSYPRIEFLLVAHGYEPDESRLRDHAESLGLTDISFLTVDAQIPLGELLNRGFSLAMGDYVWKMDDDDFYAPEFLHDLIDTVSYTEAQIVGKAAHFAYLESQDMTIYRGASLEHRYVEQVHGATMVVSRSLADEVRFPEIPQGSDTRFQQAARSQGARIYGADRFNFVYVRTADPTRHTWQASDLRLLANSVYAFPGYSPDQVTL